MYLIASNIVWQAEFIFLLWRQGSIQILKRWCCCGDNNFTSEIHKDANSKGERVFVHDDLLATGGTAKAAINLVEKLGGEVVQVLFLLELSFLNGRERLKGYNVKSLVDYTNE